MKLDKLLLETLIKWCEEKLDQWERWEIKTKYGSVYIQISREPDEYNYNKIN